MQPLETPQTVPLYRRVEASLRDQIRNGELAPGDLIPSEPQLAASLGVSPGTVRKAIDLLVRERLLFRHQGKGTYVSRIDFNNSLFRFFSYGDAQGGDLRIHKETSLRVLQQAPADVCARLSIQSGSPAIYMERIGFDTDTPVLFERSWWDAGVVDGLQDESVHIPDLLYAVVEDRFGVPVVRAEETLTAEACDERTASHLAIDQGSPIVVLRRRAFSSGDKPIEYRVTHGRADRFSYRTEIR